MENVTGSTVRASEAQVREDRELRLQLLMEGQIVLTISQGEEIVVDAVELIDALAKECRCSHRDTH